MKHVNFIPHDLRPKSEIPGMLIPTGLFLLLLLNAGGAILWNAISTHEAQNELARIESENAELTKKIDTLGGSKRRLKLDETIENMKKVLAKKNYWSAIFKEMSVLIPEGIWLTGFSDIKETNVVRTAPAKKPGSALLLVKGESASHEVIARFLTVLEKSQNFAGVQMKFSEREANVQPVRYKFEFSIPIKTPTNEGGT